MTDDTLMKVAVCVLALAVASVFFTAAIGISKPHAEAKPSVSSERVTNALHRPVFRKNLAHWQR
jgi:hypothetical protein